VPVSEQLLGAGNELIAMECDTHEGLHLAGDFSDLNLKAAEHGRQSGCADGAPTLD
jgi:hypothetical protein